MEKETKEDQTAYLLAILKAQTAVVHFNVKKEGPPVFYEGRLVEGFTTLFHIVDKNDDHHILVSGCNVGSSDLRRSLSAIATALVENYDIPRKILALTLIQIAKDMVDGE